MNIDTGEIRDWELLSDEERMSGRWIPLLYGKGPFWGQERKGSNGRTYRLNALGQYQRVRELDPKKK